MADSDLLLTLAHWIAGDFSNQQQAFEDAKNYAHIHVFFRPLPWDFFGGIGFYSEQVYDYDLWRPYRQGVHRFIDRGEDIYIENYSLQNPMFYAGAGRELSILRSIKPDKIDRRYHCSMIFQRQGNLFRGQVEGNSCFIEKYGKKTYLVSDVELTENTFVSFDRGLDVDNHEQVWGSTAGALKFVKIQNFAAEVPSMI
ncbi:putative phycoerythrobilin lyase CpeT [Microcystis aeruginosa NIES-1211]|jgi:CpeT protein|uniref:Chromophore lyase CpcT/CpeT n=1 Tax=Microcystis aeruginosa NIES-2519 TaxID=2303981 RepID=A0A5A5R098_MICAE|nr:MULTISPECIES: chromophore lyase CpcT/CpeT [Microcystis]AVQ71594.1 chorismate-binding protein [Microcystis sp. MC19]GBL14601.1 putative phycoerythrobilin lyase CpeT [Microcystis aeruginosa NIES-1211]GCA68630.1 putative phycoerythrobilin lyase CpeT [Microcystis aeruginosa NIES-2519]GCA82414.1 putative phycoerythrobilin lyase CpeT [Microcystis aeruginosa NIES-2522]